MGLGKCPRDRLDEHPPFLVRLPISVEVQGQSRHYIGVDTNMKWFDCKKPESCRPMDDTLAIGRSSLIPMMLSAL